MRKRYTKEQIIKAFMQHEAGAKVADICRELGVSDGPSYNWRSKYAELEVNEAKRLKELESDNSILKRQLAEKLLEVDAPALAKDASLGLAVFASASSAARHFLYASRSAAHVREKSSRLALRM